MERWKKCRKAGPRFRVTAKAAQDKLFEADRHPCPMPSNRRWRLRKLRIGFAVAFFRKWHVAGEQFVKSNSETENVGRRRNLFKPAFFWRNVAFGTRHATRARSSLPSRNPEIAQNGPPLFHDDVGWLYIKMQYAAVVDMAECGADINRYSQCIVDAQSPLRSALHQLVQAWSFQILHEKPGRPIHPKAAHDIGMRERQQDVGLALRCLIRLQHFAQHWAPGFVVPNKVHRLVATIVDNTENGEVWIEPCANFNFGSTFNHHHAATIKSVTSISSRLKRDRGCHAGTFQSGLRDNSPRRRVSFHSG